MSNFTEFISQAILAVAVLAFVVSVMTEVIKNVGFMKKIPTNLVVIVLSMVLTLVAFFAYAQYSSLAIVWYLVLAAFIAGFFVSFVAMYGWDKISELWSRFKPKK